MNLILPPLTTMRLVVDARIAVITIDHPPINLLDAAGRKHR